MNARTFLDTNVFVYTFDSASPAKARRATEIIRLAITSGKGMVSYQIIQEFLNVALRKFARPMTIEEAQLYLMTVFVPLLSVHSSASLYADALRISGRYLLSWYDSLVVAAAVQGKCGVLYSEDLQDGMKIGNLRVENPFR